MSFAFPRPTPGLVSILTVRSSEGTKYKVKYSPPSDAYVNLSIKQMRHMVVELITLKTAPQPTASSSESGWLQSLDRLLGNGTPQVTLDGGPHGRIQWIACADESTFDRDAPGDRVARLYGCTEPHCCVQLHESLGMRPCGVSSMIYTSECRKAEFESILSRIRAREGLNAQIYPAFEIVTGLYRSKKFPEGKRPMLVPGDDIDTQKRAAALTLVQAVVDELRREDPLLDNMSLDFCENETEVMETRTYMSRVSDA